jgi:hypothetical protein
MATIGYILLEFATIKKEPGAPAHLKGTQRMFDFVQLGLIVAVAAAILGSALAYAWRDAARGAPRGGHDGREGRT